MVDTLYGPIELEIDKGTQPGTQRKIYNYGL